MSYPQVDNEKKERIRIAKTLDRQEFWKDVFLSVLRNGYGADLALSEANGALEQFDAKFGGVT